MRKFIYLLPFALMILGSCMKSSNDTTPLPVPTGTFSGVFRKIHRNTRTSKLDTVKTNLVLYMNLDSGYKVVSDTTTIHAGSKGGFQLNGTYILFVDNTYPASGSPAPAKTHLNGTYAYAYDGINFLFYAPVNTTGTDSLFYQYELKQN